jgi:hypothetical protein
MPRSIKVASFTLVFLLVGLLFSNKAFAANSVSPDTATVEFSACTMDLDNSFCSPSATSLNFNFTNIYSNPSVNETIQKFGFYNSGAGSYKWGNNNPFYVANIVTGTWSNSEYLTYNWSVAKNSSGLIMLKFAPNMALINSCMSTGKTYCEFVTTLYFNPSYCGGDISQGNCNIVGGIAITLKGRVNFLLPKTSLSTNVLDFGNVEVGQTKTLSATLSNTSNQETLNSYGFPLGNDFSSDVDGKNLLVYLNTNKVINYTFKPTQVGTAQVEMYYPDQRYSVNLLYGLGPKLLVKGNGIQTQVISSSSSSSASSVSSSVSSSSSSLSSSTSSSETLSTSSSSSLGSSQVSSNSSSSNSSSSNVVTSKSSSSAQVEVQEVKAFSSTLGVTIDTPIIDIKGTQSIVTLNGTGPINATLKITIYSTPITKTVNTDSQGRWTITLLNELSAGTHSVYATRINEKGEVAGENEKIAEFTLVENVPVSDTSVVPTSDFGSFYILFALVLLLAGLYYMYRNHMFKRLKDKIEVKK